jgi:signal transduction histidine kinase
MALENARHAEMTRRAISARDDFIVLASHELRTPLSSLTLLVEHRMKRRRRGEAVDDPKQDDAIARQVTRLVGLVERMLEAVRVETEGIPLSLEECDMTALVQKAVASAQERASRAGAGRVELRSEVDGNSVRGHWDPLRLGKALEELLDNAIKFSVGTPIEVTLRQQDEDVVVSVHDHGAGVPPDRIGAIFSPFERAVSKQHFGGLGLGLFVARASVEAHGGSLDVVSPPGEGSTFTLRVSPRPPARL